MDASQIEQVVTELGTAFNEFKETNDAVLEKKANKSDVDPLVTEKLDKLQTAMDRASEQLDTAGKELKASQDAGVEMKERLDELETAAARSGHGTTSPAEELELRQQAHGYIMADSYEAGARLDLEPEDVDQKDVDAFGLYKKHFHSYIRHGEARFLKKMGGPNLETKLLSVDREPGGGYWVKPEMSARITKIVFETSPIRQFATVENIGSDSLELIADENEAGFGWVAEQEARPETTTPDIGKRVIFAHELYAEPRVTQKLLDDAGFNVEGWLSNKVAERFARAEATAFVSGTGVGQPRGFITYPAGTATGQIEQVTATGTADTLDEPDDLFNLLYSIKTPYLANARWMSARLTIRDIRKLKDTQNRYLWEPSLKVGEPAMLLGYPQHQADDMPAVNTGDEPLAFGDFRAAYTIVDRFGVRVLRDPFTAKPYIKLYTTKRVGGDVVNFEAIKLLTIN